MLSQNDELLNIYEKIENVFYSLEALDLLLSNSKDFNFISSLTRPISAEIKEQNQKLFALIQGGEK